MQDDKGMRESGGQRQPWACCGLGDLDALSVNSVDPWPLAASLSPVFVSGVFVRLFNITACPSRDGER